jgi:hypothetical protein
MNDDHYTKLVPYNIPCSTLKDYTEKFLEDPAKSSVANIGQPFIMPHSIEIIAVNHILSMQDLGSSLRVKHVRCVAFKVVEAAGIKHLFV